MRKEGVMTEKEGLSKLTSIEKCPTCGGELDKGYIHMPRGIYWDTQKHNWHVYTSETIISMWAWTLPKAPALRCKQCRIVIFDYEKEGKE